MSQYLQSIRTRVGANRATPQRQPIPGRNQVPNRAGGYGFAIDDWARLRRWLILGSEGGAYYATEIALTAENAEVALRCIRVDGPRAVRMAAEISRDGRAPKNDPALFVLALACAHGDLDTRRAAFDALPVVARTGTNLFHFAAYCDAARGWGKGLQRAIGRWYNSQDARELGYQAVKYQQRDGWSHRDLLRKTHLKPATEAHDLIYGWIARQGWDWVGPDPHPDERLRQIWAFESLKRAQTAGEAARLVADYRLPREAVPTQWLKEPLVWEALLPDMPVTALIRNLATLTRLGLIAPLSDTTRLVVERLRDERRLRAARVHPIALLSALKTYQAGQGERGHHEWTPVQPVVDALDGAFYRAFGTLQPTGLRWLLGVDISGSMDAGCVAGSLGLFPRLAAAAMSLITAAVEPQHTIVAFESKLTRLKISSRQRLDQVMTAMQDRRMKMGRTDCSLPMVWALDKRVPVDVFVVYTDNETWYGKIHPAQALERYRQEMGIAARLVVVAFTGTQVSIADPADPGMLDVVGFDTAAPQLMVDFARGLV